MTDDTTRRTARQMLDAERGTGHTTRQMLATKKGGVFVWCNSMLQYPRNLARKLDRDDLRIVAPIDLDRIRGTRYTDIKIDHAARLSPEQVEFIGLMRTRTIGVEQYERDQAFNDKQEKGQ